MENTAEEERETRARSEYFWHTYYGFPSEMLGCDAVILCIRDISSYGYIMIIIGNGGSIKSKMRR